MLETRSNEAHKLPNLRELSHRAMEFERSELLHSRSPHEPREQLQRKPSVFQDELLERGPRERRPRVRLPQRAGLADSAELAEVDVPDAQLEQARESADKPLELLEVAQGEVVQLQAGDRAEERKAYGEHVAVCRKLSAQAEVREA